MDIFKEFSKFIVSGNRRKRNALKGSRESRRGNSMLPDEYKRLTRDAVFRLRYLFRSNPHIFLTEDDIRCVLYKLLISQMKDAFRRCEDGSLSSPVHAEVRWYGKRRNLNKRSDLVVLDINDLRVTNKGFPLPTKGFGFNNFYAVMELKLRRQGGDSDRVWLEKLKKDADTLLLLRTEVDNAYEPLLLLIAFDKKSNIKDKIEQASLGIEVIYESIL